MVSAAPVKTGILVLSFGMPVAPAPSSVRPDLPFRFVGGDLSVDLVNTADWTSQGPREDRIGSYSRLVRWAEESGVVTSAQGEVLRRRGDEHPLEARAALEAATSLRWVLQRLYVSLAGGAVDDAAVADFNCALDDAMRRVDIRPGADRTAPLVEGYEGFGVHLESLLWPVTRQAARLVTSADAQKLRVCAHPECGWMFVDRSRNGLRCWCRMESCGTRAKSERRRRRSPR